MTAILGPRPAMLAAVAVAAVLTVGGCDSGSSADYRPGLAPAVTTADEQATTEPVANDPTQPPQPPKPAGSVPRSVLGTWVGGQDDRSDYTFIAVSAGEYRLEHAETPAVPAFVEQGWIVGDADRLLLRPVQVQGVRTRERTAGWYRMPNDAGVDLLVISDPLFGELTYARGDA